MPRTGRLYIAAELQCRSNYATLSLQDKFGLSSGNATVTINLKIIVARGNWEVIYLPKFYLRKHCNPMVAMTKVLFLNWNLCTYGIAAPMNRSTKMKGCRFWTAPTLTSVVWLMTCTAMSGCSLFDCWKESMLTCCNNCSLRQQKLGTKPFLGLAPNFLAF